MIDGLKPYAAMKESGVAWLGQVPNHWEIARLKRLCRFAYGDALASEARSGGDIPVFGSNGRVGSHDVANTLGPCIVIGRKGSFGKITYSAEPVFAIDTAFFVDKRFTRAAIRWLSYLLGSLKLDEVSKDSAIPGLDRDDAYKSVVVIPPIEEQSAIVGFLDRADSRIRHYIRAKQKLIKLLEEEKQAIIHRAVTRGIERNVRLNPSGVQWLGDVPEHWEVRRAKYLFREVDKRSIDGSEQHLSMSQTLGLVPSEQVENKTLVSENYAGGKLCEAGDIVLNRLKAHLGVFALSRFSGVISPDYTVFRPIEPAGVVYFESVLRSPGCRHELRIRAKGIVEGFWRLYTDDFYNIRLPVPSPSERQEIVDYIEHATANATRAAERILQEIQLLREYRTQLIADVVTGKLDVREAATRLPEEIPEPEPLDETEEMEENEETAEHAELEAEDAA